MLLPGTPFSKQALTESAETGSNHDQLGATRLLGFLRLLGTFCGRQLIRAPIGRSLGATKSEQGVVMSESAFLNGKVLKRSLPALQLPLGPEAPLLKRLFFPQGELAQFYDADEGIRYIAFIELLPGQVRGNHYHKVKEELVYIIRGEILLRVLDIDSEARASLPLRAGDLAVIKTGIAHALQTMEPGQAVEFSTSRFDGADIHRYQIQTT
jgi:hypothetical protein